MADAIERGTRLLEQTLGLLDEGNLSVALAAAVAVTDPGQNRKP